MFANREAAGRALAQRLRQLRWEHPVVEGIARGGVIVAAQVARALHSPLDAAIVRKIRAPFQPEFALGAVAEDGTIYVSRALAGSIGTSPEELHVLTAEALDEAREMSSRLKRRDPVDVQDRTVILIDDGLATGATATAAARSLRKRGARRVVLAVPVGAPQTIERLEGEVDEIVTLIEPSFFRAVGEWYEEFAQTTDEEVEAALDADRDGNGTGAREPKARSKRVNVPVRRR